MNTITFDLAQFKPYILEKDGGSWIGLANSPKEFCVHKENDKLVISRYHEKLQYKFEFNDFDILAHNAGEWGGGITIISKKDQSNQTLLPERGIAFVFEWDGTVYFVESLSHMWSEIGTLYELVINGEVADCRSVFDISEAPRAFTIADDKLYMTSEKNLFIIHKNQNTFSKEYVRRDLPLQHSNSLVKDGEVFYVGTQGGVMKINVASGEVVFLKYQE